MEIPTYQCDCDSRSRDCLRGRGAVGYRLSNRLTYQASTRQTYVVIGARVTVWPGSDAEIVTAGTVIVWLDATAVIPEAVNVAGGMVKVKGRMTTSEVVVSCASTRAPNAMAQSAPKELLTRMLNECDVGTTVW